MRPLLMWLLMLAIPLQGLAAQSMLLCASRHEMVAAPAHGTGAMDASGHGHGDAYGDDHSAVHGAATGLTPADEGTSSASPGHHDHGQSGASGHGLAKCGGVGCAVAALLASASPAVLQTAEALPQPAGLPLPLGVVPALPEFPPRASCS